MCYILETSGIMSRLFGYTAAAADRDTAAIEAFEKKKIEAKENYWFVNNTCLYLHQVVSQKVSYFYRLNS